MEGTDKDRHEDGYTFDGTENDVTYWNWAYPVGTPVRYWAGERVGEGVASVTRSAARMLGGHTPVVWVEGCASCIALTHVERDQEG